MNLFKWAKQKIASAFEPSKPPTPKPRTIHAAKAEAQSVVATLRAEAKRRRNNPTQAARRKWKWFHISKWPEQIKDRKTGVRKTIWKFETYRRATGPNVKAAP